MGLLLATLLLTVVASAASSVNAAPLGAEARAQSSPFQTVENDSCPTCRSQCVKPWTIPDTWDDGTLIPGWPSWKGNGKYDAEEFTDLNADGLWNPGEPYRDGKDRNGNSGLPDGQYTSEWYHPILTGYTFSRNGGKLIVLHPGSPEDAPVPGQYYAVDLDPYGDPTGNRYEWNIANCSVDFTGPGDFHALRPGRSQEPTVRGVTALIAVDPTAYYDSLTQTVVSSQQFSPRRMFIAIHDPRIPIDSGRRRVQTVKIAAFFMEAIRENGDVVGRFIRVQSPGFPCPREYPRDAVFLFACP